MTIRLQFRCKGTWEGGEGGLREDQVVWFRDQAILWLTSLKSMFLYNALQVTNGSFVSLVHKTFELGWRGGGGIMCPY